MSVETVGEEVSLHAGAHPTSAPESLHREAPRYRGELPADGQHPAGSTGALEHTEPRTHPLQKSPWSVSFHVW